MYGSFMYGGRIGVPPNRTNMYSLVTSNLLFGIKDIKIFF